MYQRKHILFVCIFRAMAGIQRQHTHTATATASLRCLFISFHAFYFSVCVFAIGWNTQRIRHTNVHISRGQTKPLMEKSLRHKIMRRHRVGDDAKKNSSKTERK